MLSWIAEPFQQVTVRNVGQLWVVLLVVQMIVASGLQKIGLLEDLEINEFLDDHSTGFLIVAVGVITPIGEELVFRIIPLILAVEFGVPIEPVVLVGTTLWVLGHGERALITAIGAILYIKLALGMFLLPLIIVHVFNNTVMIISYKLRKWYES